MEFTPPASELQKCLEMPLSDLAAVPMELQPNPFGLQPSFFNSEPAVQTISLLIDRWNSLAAHIYSSARVKGPKEFLELFHSWASSINDPAVFSYRFEKVADAWVKVYVDQVQVGQGRTELGALADLLLSVAGPIRVIRLLGRHALLPSISCEPWMTSFLAKCQEISAELVKMLTFGLSLTAACGATAVKTALFMFKVGCDQFDFKVSSPSPGGGSKVELQFYVAQVEGSGRSVASALQAALDSFGKMFGQPEDAAILFDLKIILLKFDSEVDLSAASDPPLDIEMVSSVRQDGVKITDASCGSVGERSKLNGDENGFSAEGVGSLNTNMLPPIDHNEKYVHVSPNAAPGKSGPIYASLVEKPELWLMDPRWHFLSQALAEYKPLEDRLGSWRLELDIQPDPSSLPPKKVKKAAALAAKSAARSQKQQPQMDPLKMTGSSCQVLDDKAPQLPPQFQPPMAAKCVFRTKLHRPGRFRTTTYCVRSRLGDALIGALVLQAKQKGPRNASEAVHVRRYLLARILNLPPEAAADENLIAEWLLQYAELQDENGRLRFWFTNDEEKHMLNDIRAGFTTDGDPTHNPDRLSMLKLLITHFPHLSLYLALNFVADPRPWPVPGKLAAHGRDIYSFLSTTYSATALTTQIPGYSPEAAAARLRDRSRRHEEDWRRNHWHYAKRRQMRKANDRWARGMANLGGSGYS